jgi:hypothetical protein
MPPDAARNRTINVARRGCPSERVTRNAYCGDHPTPLDGSERPLGATHIDGGGWRPDLRGNRHYATLEVSDNDGPVLDVAGN